MLYKEHANGWLDENLVKDVNNVHIRSANVTKRIIANVSATVY